MLSRHRSESCCGCEVCFMGIGIFIWFPHELFLEAILSLKGIYFCLEVWWSQSSHEPHRCELSASKPIAFSPKGGPCMWGFLMCLFVVKIIFTSLRNWVMTYKAHLGRRKSKLTFLTETGFAVPWWWDTRFTNPPNLPFCFYNCNHLTSHADYVLFKCLNCCEEKGIRGRSHSQELLDS